MLSKITAPAIPYLVGAIAILLITFSSYFFYANWQFQKKDNMITATKLAVIEQNKLIEQQLEDITSIKDITRRLNENQQSLQTRERNLVSKLSRLQAIAIERPEMTEQLINNATIERIRCIALATGAMPRENEVNELCANLLQ